MKPRIELVVFDMDGVLVDTSSSWLFVHEALNVDSSNNLTQYLQGKITYKEFMRRDIRLWGDIHINALNNILDEVPIMIGAKRTIPRLRKKGYKTMILSSGISILAERVKEDLEIDYCLANKILFNEEGIVTGEGEETVPLLEKVDVLRDFVLREGIALYNTAVVGDSVYDIPLFKKSGFSVAFNTREERVREIADVVIEDKNLSKILPYFIDN